MRPCVGAAGRVAPVLGPGSGAGCSHSTDFPRTSAQAAEGTPERPR